MKMQTYANLREPMLTYARKKNVMIKLNPNWVTKAHELGLSISKITENALIETITKLQGCDSQEKERSWWAGRDLNSRPSACQADVLTKLDDRPNRS